MSSSYYYYYYYCKTRRLVIARKLLWTKFYRPYPVPLTRSQEWTKLFHVYTYIKNCPMKISTIISNKLYVSYYLKNNLHSLQQYNDDQNWLRKTLVTAYINFQYTCRAAAVPNNIMLEYVCRLVWFLFFTRYNVAITVFVMVDFGGHSNNIKYNSCLKFKNVLGYMRWGSQLYLHCTILLRFLGIFQRVKVFNGPVNIISFSNNEFGVGILNG